MKLSLVIFLACVLQLPSPIKGWSPPKPWSSGATTTDAAATTIVETADGGTQVMTKSPETTTEGGSSWSSWKSSLTGGGGSGGDQCSILSSIGITPSQVQGQMNELLNDAVSGTLKNLNSTINPLIQQVVEGAREELEQIKQMTAGLKNDLLYEVNEIKNETIGLIKDVVGDALELVQSLRDQILETVETTLNSVSNIVDKLKYQVVDIEKSLLDMVKNMTEQVRTELLSSGQLLDDIGKITADIGKLISTTISNIATDENQQAMERMLTQLNTAIRGQSNAQDASIESREKEEDHAQEAAQKASSTIGSFNIMGLISTLLGFFSLDNEFLISRLGVLLWPLRVIFEPELISPYVIAVCDFAIDTIDQNEEFVQEQVRQMSEVFFTYIQKPGALSALFSWVKNTFKVHLNFNWNHDAGVLG